jgi:hypothetical protein
MLIIMIQLAGHLCNLSAGYTAFQPSFSHPIISFVVQNRIETSTLFIHDKVAGFQSKLLDFSHYC